MMTMSEMKTNDTMKKTEITMDDASECVSTRTCGSHAPSRMRSHDAKPVAPEQSKNPDAFICARAQARLVGLAAACDSFGRRDDARK